MDKILGAPFDKYVHDQIEVRQKSLSKSQKTENDLVVFNSSTPWVRLSSSIKVSEGRAKTLAINLGINQSEIVGRNLAKNLVLFAGTSDGANLSKRKGGVGYGLESNYGFLSDEKQGYRPMPGITDISATYKNNGTLKQAQINLKCFTRKQFEAIEAIYLRLGYTMLLEWGHSTYFDNKGIKRNMTSLEIPNLLFKQKELTLPTKIKGPEDLGSVELDLRSFKINDFLKLDKNARKSLATSLGKTVGELQSTLTDPGYATKLRIALSENKKKTGGNYDAMLAKVQNFSWSLNDDLSYNITLDLISVGDIIDSLKMNFGGTKLTGASVNNVNTVAGLRNLANIKLQSGASAFNSFLSELVQQLDDQKVKGALDQATQEAIKNLDEGVLLEPLLEGIKKEYSEAIKNYRVSKTGTYFAIQKLLLQYPKVGLTPSRVKGREEELDRFPWQSDSPARREELAELLKIPLPNPPFKGLTLIDKNGDLTSATTTNNFYNTFGITVNRSPDGLTNTLQKTTLPKNDFAGNYAKGISELVDKINEIETYFNRLKVETEVGKDNFQLIEYLNSNKNKTVHASNVIKRLIQKRQFNEAGTLKLDGDE